MTTLIQRVVRRKYMSEHSKGVDRMFEFDYMGRAEFEFGTIPQALKAMRSRKDGVWDLEPAVIVVGEHTAYYVGAPETFDVAVQVFEDQLKTREERKLRPLEWTYIHETYVPNPRSTLGPFHGWWVLDGSMPFLLFKEKAHAEDWIKVL